MDNDRSKRLGKLLESANEFEARQRRSSTSSMVWGALIIVMLVGMFFAGRAWYSLAPTESRRQSDEARASLAAESMTPGPAPVVAVPMEAQAPAAAPTPASTLPDEVELTSGAELQIRRAGKVVGVIYLKAGDKVRPTARDGGKLTVAWGEAEGTVLVSATTLGKE